jgi:hypothetical protein
MSVKLVDFVKYYIDSKFSVNMKPCCKDALLYVINEYPVIFTLIDRRISPSEPVADITCDIIKLVNRHKSKMGDIGYNCNMFGAFIEGLMYSLINRNIIASPEDLDAHMIDVIDVINMHKHSVDVVEMGKECICCIFMW